MTFARAVAAAVALASAMAILGQEPKQPEALRVRLPGKSWELQVDTPGFAIQINETKPDGKRYLVAENKASGVTLSVTLEQVEGEARVEDCRRIQRERIKTSELKVVDVKESQIGDMAVSEYVFPTIGGVAFQQKNVFGCTAKEDVYVDIHLSKVQFKPADQGLFTAILKGVRIADLNPSGQDRSRLTSAEYFKEGSRYYIGGQYDKAIAPYQQALDLEKKDRKLDGKWWHVLIDNLSIAYGITGDLKSAEDVITYGISKDSTYPMFYYNMACVTAGRNDLDNTIKYLTTAFSYKQNMIPGEKMPDPRKDDSFQRFLENEKFRALLDSLN
jgi:tetratricopeptide (TPR) repeat protein